MKRIAPREDRLGQIAKFSRHCEPERAKQSQALTRLLRRFAPRNDKIEENHSCDPV